MRADAAEQAATILLEAWHSGDRIEALPDTCQPKSRAEGYIVQAALEVQSGQPRRGWKIAATSAAGQSHIGVDAPLAGALLADRCIDSKCPLPMTGNLMGVAEAEFAFRLGRDLPKRSLPYTPDDVMQAVDAAYPAIEVPDSRFTDFARVGAAQLVADVACAAWFVLGKACPPRWREVNLARHAVHVHRNGEPVREGSGANVLGDPRVALAWIANELCTYAEPLAAGDIVTTGTCIVPLEVTSGDSIRADFGMLGEIEVAID